MYIMIKIAAMMAEIHNGDSTHTHAHEITPKSFSAINKIANIPVKPIPPVLIFFLLSFSPADSPAS